MITSIFNVHTILSKKNEHFISVDYKVYRRFKYIIILLMLLNRDYRLCEIYRKRYKAMNNFVVVGLRWRGKNVKRRTSGFAKEFVASNDNPKCIYCKDLLTYDNATADHIIPISKGGNNSQVNLMVCCHTCNAERGNMEFYEYLNYKNSSKKIKIIFI